MPWFAISLRRAVTVLAVGVVLATTTVSSEADETAEPENPGLPHIVCTDKQKEKGACQGDEERNLYQWLNFVQSGMTGSVPSKQWARLPLTMIASTALLYQTDTPPPGEQNPPGELASKNFEEADAFLVSPKGSKNAYGDSALIPIRTVAFGSIPAQITLQVSQPRDKNDLPRPINLVAQLDQYVAVGDSARVVLHPAKVDTSVSIRVARLVIDGVDVGLGDACQTGPRARLSVASDAGDLLVTAPDDISTVFDPSKGFYDFYGGTLHGTIDIPAFDGCATRSGDDVSALLTSAISSKSNPVTLQLGALGCFTASETRPLPTQPGANTPAEANCFEIDNPNNPKLRTVPYPLDFPDYAPGENPGD